MSRRLRYLVLAICCLSLFIAGLDMTIVNVVGTGIVVVALALATTGRGGQASAARTASLVAAGDEITAYAA